MQITEYYIVEDITLDSNTIDNHANIIHLTQHYSLV